MKYVSSFLIAFSMYSKIPVPQADWEKSSMEYVMCFSRWWELSSGVSCMGLPGRRIFCYSPAAVGGCSDCASSMDFRRDPHGWLYGHKRCALFLGRFPKEAGNPEGQPCGSFCRDGAWDLSSALLRSMELYPARAGTFLCQSGLCDKPGFKRTFCYFLSQGKKDRLLCDYVCPKGTEEKGISNTWTVAFAASALLLVFGGRCGWICLLAAAAVYVWYYYISKKQFGGITGDLAGYFVQLLELVFLLAAAVTG